MPLHNYRCLLCMKRFEILHEVDQELKFCAEHCQMEYYIGGNHLYTPARELQGMGVVKKVYSTVKEN